VNMENNPIIIKYIIYVYKVMVLTLLNKK
jgi:hypothetical protein